MRGVYRKQSSWLCSIFVGASFQRGAGPSGSLLDVVFAKACCLAGEKTEANPDKIGAGRSSVRARNGAKLSPRGTWEGIQKQEKKAPGVRGRFLSFKCNFGRPQGSTAGGRRGPRGVPFCTCELIDAVAGRKKVVARRVPESFHTQAPNMHRFVSQRHLFQGEKSFKSLEKCAKITISTLPPVTQKPTPKNLLREAKMMPQTYFGGTPGPWRPQGPLATPFGRLRRRRKKIQFVGGFQNASKTASEPTKGEKRSKRPRGPELVPPHTPLYKGTR